MSITVEHLKRVVADIKEDFYEKRSSAYYKQGYDFGLVMYCQSRLDMSAEMENEHELSKVKK